MIKTKKYFIVFGYKTWQSGEKVTDCYIRDVDTDELLSTGHAICSVKDNFSKEEGRKVALSKAMANLSISKQDRLEIWFAYHCRDGGLCDKNPGVVAILSQKVYMGANNGC